MAISGEGYPATCGRDILQGEEYWQVDFYNEAFEVSGIEEEPIQNPPPRKVTVLVHTKCMNSQGFHDLCMDCAVRQGYDW